jgi:glycosyltransferase involved in cell wall biosynthesis
MTEADPLSLLVDGRHLSGFGATRGFGRYLRSLLAELAQDPRLNVEVLVDEAGVAAVPPGARAALVRRRVPGRFADLEHRVRLPLDIARHRSTLFHSPAAEPPRSCRRPWVQTIHDVPLSFPDADLEAELLEWRRRRHRVPHANGVIAVSRYVADRATTILELDPERVYVAPHGVDPVFRPGPDRGVGGAPGTDPYVLVVGEYGHHKGYAEAFATIGALADRGLPQRLVVVGRLAPWWKPVVDGLIANSPHPERIEMAGLAGDEELAGWYRGADALIVTSRAEGFCLPVIEAMACGTPVIAFDNTALPETVGDGGQLVPDGDIRAMASALEALVSDQVRWRAASEAARRRAVEFSWEACASIHVLAFEKAARGGKWLGRGPSALREPLT